MSRKAFVVQVELDVQSVTCPGVWLCSNGKVSLQIYMLDSCVQTESYRPLFPIKCQEKFTFYKSFYSRHRLNELQKELRTEWLYVELIQWQSCDVGNVLATFQTTLDELLFPSTHKGSIAGVDVDLLMEPSRMFPGTIGPKVEVSTRTTIEETLCVCKRTNSSTVVVNPKVLVSMEKRDNNKRGLPRRVCHSLAYSKRAHLDGVQSRPPFQFRKADDNLIMRKLQPETSLKGCSCREVRKKVPQKTAKLRPKRVCPCTVLLCSCGSGHKEHECPVCAKYNTFFKITSLPLSPQKAIQEEVSSKPRTHLFDKPIYQTPSSPVKSCICCNKTDHRRVQHVKEDQDSGCSCCSEKPKSLAQKLHEKFNEALSLFPDSNECLCYNDQEPIYDNCSEIENSSINDNNNKSNRLFCDNFKEFYGKLYDKNRTSSGGFCHVPDCNCYV